MKENRAGDALRKYFETATPEEQKKYAEALLSARSRVAPSSVPDSVIFASRWLSLLLAIFYGISVGWSEDLLRAVGFLVVLGIVAWFPNETGEATGRIGIGPAVSRPSHPWILFVIAWMFLLLLGIGAALEWVDAANKTADLAVMVTFRPTRTVRSGEGCAQGLQDYRTHQRAHRWRSGAQEGADVAEEEFRTAFASLGIAP